MVAFWKMMLIRVELVSLLMGSEAPCYGGGLW